MWGRGIIPVDNFDSRIADGWSSSQEFWKKGNTWTMESGKNTGYRGSWNVSGQTDIWMAKNSWENCGWSGSSDNCKGGYRESMTSKNDGRSGSWGNWGNGRKSNLTSVKNSAGIREVCAERQTQRHETAKQFRQMNQEIVKAAKTNQQTFLNVLNNICNTKKQLNVVNVATLLHRSAKLGCVYQII